MKERILISGVGMTDPIRGEFDGPILHIVRHYKPKKVYLILSSAIGESENKYHHNEQAVHLLEPECEVHLIESKIENIHSYDELISSFFVKGNQICNENPECEVLLNITSGTPQMETTMCMIAIANPQQCTAIQVETPEKKDNRKVPFFIAEQDDIEEFMQNNLDNLEEAENRCFEPALMNFKRPMLQFQIESLIDNYDYEGATTLCQTNPGVFSEKTLILLQHASARLKLDNENARKLARSIQLENELYPVKRADLSVLTEYYLSMKVKQKRQELNDFVLRLQVLTESLGSYMLEKKMKIDKEDFCIKKRRALGNIYYVNREKSEKNIPGVVKYLDGQFSNTRLGRFDWEKPINALTVAYILSFKCQEEAYQKYAEEVAELLLWSKVSSEVRNAAAHSIVSVTDQDVKDSYDGKDSATLCQVIEKVFKRIGANELPIEAFGIYERINEKIRDFLRV